MWVFVIFAKCLLEFLKFRLRPFRSAFGRCLGPSGLSWGPRRAASRGQFSVGICRFSTPALRNHVRCVALWCVWGSRAGWADAVEHGRRNQRFFALFYANRQNIRKLSIKTLVSFLSIFADFGLDRSTFVPELLGAVLGSPCAPPVALGVLPWGSWPGSGLG